MISHRRALIVACAAYAVALASAACGPADPNAASAAPAAAPAATASGATAGGLTPFQIEHGIGPITAPVSVDAKVDEKMAKHGHELFEQKCSACHKMSERYVGPALGEVTKRRTPAFVMNMVLNPQGMVEKHPVTKKLLGEFFVPMPNQNLTPDEARQVVEYLRAQAR